MQVLKWLEGGPLELLHEQHVPQLEAGLEAALAVTDTSWELQSKASCPAQGWVGCVCTPAARNGFS